jgi:hypothetical protein
MERYNFKLFLLIFLAVFLAGYFLYQAKWYLLGPRLTIESPRPGEAVHDAYLKINGRAFNVASLFMNGRQIFTDKNGIFEERLLLARGYNIIELTAADKFGRVKKEKREVVLE